MGPVTLDSFDLKILRLLQEDARVPNTKLADEIGLSPSPCLRRVRDLEQQGVIRKYVTLLDPESVGLPLNVFIQVRLERQTERSLEIFEQKIMEHPEVMECYLMTGDQDYLLRVAISDVKAFERFLMDSLTKLQVIANIKSSFALKQVKYRTALPLSDEAVEVEGKRTVAPSQAGARRTTRRP